MPSGYSRINKCSIQKEAAVWLLLFGARRGLESSSKPPGAASSASPQTGGYFDLRRSPARRKCKESSAGAPCRPDTKTRSVTRCQQAPVFVILSGGVAGVEGSQALGFVRLRFLDSLTLARNDIVLAFVYSLIRWSGTSEEVNCPAYPNPFSSAYEYLFSLPDLTNGKTCAITCQTQQRKKGLVE